MAETYAFLDRLRETYHDDSLAASLSAMRALSPAQQQQLAVELVYYTRFLDSLANFITGNSTKIVSLTGPMLARAYMCGAASDRTMFIAGTMSLSNAFMMQFDHLAKSDNSGFTTSVVGAASVSAGIDAALAVRPMTLRFNTTNVLTIDMAGRNVLPFLRSLATTSYNLIGQVAEILAISYARSGHKSTDRAHWPWIWLLSTGTLRKEMDRLRDVVFGNPNGQAAGHDNLVWAEAVGRDYALAAHEQLVPVINSIFLDRTAFGDLKIAR